MKLHNSTIWTLILAAIISHAQPAGNKLQTTLTDADTGLMLNDVGYPPGTGVNSKEKSGLKFKWFRWPKKEVIYTIDEKFTTEEKKLILKAMDYISSKTCIRFKERTTEFSRVIIQRGGGPSSCFSLIGKLGIPQKIWLEPPSNDPKVGHCIHLSVVTHELIHTIGFDHEHNQPDRNKFVDIKWGNIPIPGWVAFIKLQITFNMYEYASIMHYPANGFSKDSSLPSMVAKQGGGVTMGGTVITDGDALKINRMYGCAP